MVTSASYCAGPSLAHRILFGSTARSPAPFPAPGRSGSPATSTGFPVSRRPRGGAGGRGGLTGEKAKRVPQGGGGPSRVTACGTCGWAPLLLLLVVVGRVIPPSLPPSLPLSERTLAPHEYAEKQRRCNTN
ncbi:hypothetical protein GW17_00003136 [Ensete ventricosum]|nr:hypothetical protein GW17_00003136 [Ensete ventricosum]